MLFTFGHALGEVALVPGEAGEFDVSLEDQILFSRKAEGRFPELKELKQLIRDVVVPNMDLGHSDRRSSEGTETDG